MSHIFYVIKIAIVTFLFVLVMQIEVGHRSIENHAEGFIRKSSILEPIRQVAEGAFIASKNIYRTGIKTVDSFVTKQFRAENSPGQRKLLEIKRSLAYQKDQEKKIEQSGENEETEDQ